MQEDKTFMDYFSKVPENVKQAFSKVDGRSFAAGGATGAVAGVAVTVLCHHLDDKGVFDGVTNFVDYLKSYSNNDFEVVEVATDVIDISVDEGTDAVEVVAEIINEDGAEA